MLELNINFKMEIQYFFDKQKSLFDEEISVWCGWIGQCTIGNVSCHGTRLWFQPNAAKSFDENLIGDGNERNKFYDNLEKAHDTFPGDNCNIRADSLQKILDELECKKDSEICAYYKGSLTQFIEETYDNNTDLALILEKEETTYPILINLFPTEKVWFVFKKEEILEELNEVLKVCNTNRVTWIWI